MHLLQVLLLASSAVSAFPSNGRHQKLKNRMGGNLGTSTISTTPTSSPLYSDTVPAATYLPAVHWGTNTSGYGNLAPKDYHKFYYAQNGVNDPAQTAAMAFVATNFTLPSVALEHSDAVQDVQCPSNNSMVVSFTSSSALAFALQTWPSNDTDFILVSYFEGCGSYSDGQRSYFAVGNFTSSNSNNSITANGYNLDTIDAADFLSIEFGVYNPPGDLPPNTPNPHGFAMAPLGDDFDDLLDDLIGFENINSTSFGSFATSETPGLEEIDENVDMTDEEVADDDYIFPDLNVTFIPANVTRKRGPSLLKTKRSVAKRQSFTPTIFDASIEVPKDPQLEDSPFGKAIKIGEFSEDGSGASGKMTVFCVDCGLKGKITIKGQLDVNLNIFTGGPKVVKAQATVDGSLSAGLSLGFDAQVLFTKEIKKQILQFPISPFEIPGICSVGPQITVDARATLQLNATGQLLVGATLNMPHPTATLDLVDSKNTKSSGWDPEFKPVFKSSGKISASAELGFPVGVGIGVNVLGGLIDVKVAVVDEPSIKATVSVAGSVSLPARDMDLIDAPVEHRRYAGLIAERVPAAADTTDLVVRDLVARDDCQDGIELEVTFINRIYLDLFGNKGDDLAHNEIPIAKQCFPVGNVKNSRAVDNTTLEQVNTTSSGTEFDYELPSVLEQSYTDLEGNTYGAILETTNSDLLVTCEDGNIFLHSASDNNTEVPGCVTSWVSRNTTTVADAAGRVMHYYNDTMGAIGVSRLRMSEEEDIPVTAVFVVMKPNNDPTTPDVLQAIDEQGVGFYPIICDITGQPSKVFLASDPENGPTTLMDPSIMYSITGGVVESCAPLTVMINAN